MPFKTIEEVREYTQQEYWESGTISGYKNFFIDWQWNGNLVECFRQVYNFTGKKVLDLGCAWGQFVAALHKEGIDAQGIDLSDFAINQGKNVYPPLKDIINQGSIHNLSKFSNKAFDFLYSQQVFEHVPEQYCEQLASETFRVAKPGAIIWAGLVLDLGEDFQPEGFNPDDIDKTHINLRPKHWWDKKFIQAGWKENPEFDSAFRQTRTSHGYSFFDEYGWHSICYKKGN